MPVDIAEFADPAKRREWIELKNIQVFSLRSDTHPETTVDVFAEEPFAFGPEHDAAEVRELAPGVSLPLVRLATLIAMKREANRPIDQDDVRHLNWILDERESREFKESGE